MAGGRGGRGGHRGSVQMEGAPHRDRSIEDAMLIEDLQGQIAELTQRLAAQDPNHREAEDRETNSYSTFDNPFQNRGAVPVQRGWGNCQGDFGFKMELPYFLADGFIDCLNEVERVFDYKEVPDCVKVKLVSIKLKGRASAWWEQQKRSREKQGKAKITDWENMKKKLKGHFLPFGYTQSLFQRLHSLKQGTKSVDDYTEEFYHLVARNDLFESEEQLVARYLGGLRQPLQDSLSLHSLWTVSEAYQRALAVEKQQKRRFMTSNDQQQTSRPVRQQESRPNHPSLQAKPNSSVKCYRCGQEGHIAPNYLKQSVKNGKNLLIGDDMLDETEEVGDPIFDEYDNGDDVLYGDGQETLVIRKSLLTPKGALEDEWLRNSIFHTTCTVADKVCKMIIDSGSCENVVSEEAVQKLQLKTDNHPKPYKLSWLSKGTEIKVDEMFGLIVGWQKIF